MKKHLRNFEQAKDVLDYGIDLHGQLGALYHALGRHSDQDRAKLVLDYLGHHERERGQALRRFEQIPDVNGLDVWLQFAPNPDIERLLADCAVRPDASVDDIVDIAMRFDAALIEIYQEASRQAESTPAKGLFDHLVDMATQERQRFVRDVEWVQDI
ncbi:hypothetical protein SAMN02949497_3994 [Methylomagnum ishizawai]|uniref:Rubrerythrin n=1 Tax=Methylomagnum ishizawai TaxID=1760988 RepID=A0A1Y6D0Y8_9GAMM|nr:hypothetical protein [Methylomagnum ishizawai]SMF96589.1 hypothetical protein SAMN02949497_3994 [Methylomagnum ishizawai]